MKMKCRFEEFLSNHQEDLVRIVGKHLNTNLTLSVGEVVSTINFQLIKNKQKFFDKFGYDFSKSDFGKWAYAFARNNTKWNSSKRIDEDKHLSDGIVNTEEGIKSLFEVVCDSAGEEDESFESFDGNSKIEVVKNIINKYSNILTDHEKDIFLSLLNGDSELEMSEKHKNTRQAINLTKIKIFDKIKANYNFKIEDAPRTSPKEMAVYVDSVLDILNKVEVRRLRHHCETKKPNLNLYKYAPE